MGLIDRLTRLLGDGESGASTTPEREATDDPPGSTEGVRGVVQDTMEISGIGTVLLVRVESGRLTTGQTIEVEPGAQTGTVETIERHHQEVDAAEPGDVVGVAIEGIDLEAVEPDYRVYDATG